MSNLLTPFSQHVVDCIRKGDYAIAEELFSGSDYIVNKARMDRSEFVTMRIPTRLEHPNDWNLWLESWCFGLFPRASILRGPERHRIKLSKHESIALAHVVKAILDEQKDLAKRAKQAKKARQEAAYFLDSTKQLEAY